MMRRNAILNEASNNILANIYRISILMTRPSSTEQVLTQIVDTVKEGLGFNRCSVYLINREQQTLECKFITGFTPEKERLVKAKPFHLKRHACIETRVAQTGEPVLVKDFEADPTMTDIDRKVTERMGRGCTLYVPLTIKGTVIGILGVDKRQDEAEITEHEFVSLSIFAGYASIVIENSRLYEALLNEKKFSETVLNSSVTGIVTTDINGGITSMNPAAAHIMGINASDSLPEHRFIDEVFPAIPGLERIFHFTDMESRYIESCEYHFRKNSGDTAVLHINASPLCDDAGRAMGMIFTVQDVTSLKEREKYLQRVNRLISLGELAAGVAHEIRNPLTGIGVVLDILRRRKELSLGDLDLAEEAMAEIDRLERIVAGLLDFARPKDFNFETISINDVVEGMLFLIKKQCRNQNLLFNVRYGKNIPAVRMDQEKIRQALLNVVINAIQSMPGGGDLTIETSCRDGDGGGYDPGGVVVTIRDTGPGIPEQHRDRIFDPFFTTHSDGTGLGLSITHSVIKEHNGTITVDSQEGRGTTFTISLPVDKQSPGEG
ncbi:MAG TPA: GAF domain-containing sensor histidine kinase [Deltaproteobacteria bacterium]|nr:GAF domain-containing sensor histidine kinase [Deltaproteobacteria bacterium]